MFYSIIFTLDAAPHWKNYTCTLVASTKKLLESERAGKCRDAKICNRSKRCTCFSFYWSCLCQFWINLTQPFTKCYDYFFHSNPFFDNVLIQILSCFQTSASMNSQLHTQMKRMLRRLLGKFVQVKAITDPGEDITHASFQDAKMQNSNLTMSRLPWDLRQGTSQNIIIKMRWNLQLYRSSIGLSFTSHSTA